MEVFSLKTACLSVIAAICFTLVSLASTKDVTPKLGQADHISFVEGKAASPNGASFTKLVVTAGRWVIKPIQTYLKVVHAPLVPNDAQTAEILQKALDVRMATL